MSVALARLERRSAVHARWAALFTVVACVAGALLPAPPLQRQMLPVALAVALLGFPHGALDPLVAALRPGRRALLGFLGAYLAAAAAVVALWLVSPAAGLALFLATSALHFGLGDVPRAPGLSAGARALRVAAHGSAPIVLPAALHAGDVGEVFGWLLGAPGASVTAWITGASPALLVGWCALAALAYRERLGRRSGALELALLCAAFAVLPPLLSFAVYFCAWHSARHLLTVDAVLGDGARARALVVGLAVLAATAVPLAAAHVASSDPRSIEAIARSLFIALAALTPPHMLVTALLARRVDALATEPRMA